MTKAGRKFTKARSGPELVRALTRMGWEVVRKSKHTILRCGCGEHQISVPETVSEYRGLNNCRAAARKCQLTRQEVS